MLNSHALIFTLPAIIAAVFPLISFTVTLVKYRKMKRLEAQLAKAPAGFGRAGRVAASRSSGKMHGVKGTRRIPHGAPYYPTHSAGASGMLPIMI